MLRKLEKGQGLAEYILILVFVAVIVILVLYLLGPSIGNIFSEIRKQYWDEASPSLVVRATYCDDKRDTCVQSQKVVKDRKQTCPEAITFNGTVLHQVPGSCTVEYSPTSEYPNVLVATYCAEDLVQGCFDMKVPTKRVEAACTASVLIDDTKFVLKPETCKLIRNQKDPGGAK